MNLLNIFRAGFVRRWHTNPDLAHTCDRIDGHSGRVARIILALHPDPSVALLRAALIHDDGESVVGDIPSSAKTDNWGLELKDLEDNARDCLWLGMPFISDFGETDARWLKFADRLDAYMWAAHHAPHVLGGDGWPEAREWLCRAADQLNVTAEFDGLTFGAHIERLTCDMGKRHAA